MPTTAFLSVLPIRPPTIRPAFRLCSRLRSFPKRFCVKPCPKRRSMRWPPFPTAAKKIEYMTEGSLCDRETPEHDGLYIRYGSDDAPCAYTSATTAVFRSAAMKRTRREIVFEQGKRHFIALPESLFSKEAPFADAFAEDTDTYERHAPIHLCVSTEKIDNRMTPHGGSLSVSYSIEVNGMIAEVSDFTLTADALRHAAG